MRKTIWSFMVCAVLGLFLLIPTTTAAAVLFTDIKGHWAEPNISTLVDGKYIKGYGDNTFRPDRTISRAEFLTILMNIKGLKASSSSANSFGDISGHWARGLINEAVSQGIVVKNEYSGIFKPDQALQRSEATAMMVRALGQQPDNGPITFTDKANVEKSIYRGYIKSAYDLGLISGFNDGQFKPFESITRAQACTVLNNFLKKTGTTTPLIGTGVLNHIVVAGNTYDFMTTPIYIKVGLNEIRITSLSITGGAVFVNNAYLYSLNATTYPDLIVNNNRYVVNGLSISGNSLVVTPASMRLNRLALNNLRYDPEFVKLYVGLADSNYYLYDMEIIDQYTVKVGSKEIDLWNNSITIAPGNQFYIVKRVLLGSGDTALELIETDPVIFNRLSLSDITDIYVGKSRFDMKEITRLDFIIDGTNYALREVTIDASGNFSVDGKTYTYTQVKIIINGDYYSIKDIRVYNGKFTLYCETSGSSLVRINDQFYDVDGVQILKDGTPYALESVLVVKRNLVRIGGRQYNLDSTFKCRYNNKVYDIKEIDYNITLNLVTIRVSESSTTSGQPSNYMFYCDGYLLRESTTDPVYIYANRSWKKFNQVNIIDPTSYISEGKTYDLVEAWIRIAGQEYKIIDTVWQGSTQQFRIHLEKF